MSGIYIKGIEMPNDCRDCAFETYYLNCGETRCRATGKTLATDFKAISFDGRANDCPLVAVPNHGRLIDADALQKSIEYVAGLDWNINVGASKGLEAAAYMVEDAMTIIPADKGGE